VSTRTRATAQSGGPEPAVGSPVFLVGPARSGTSLLYKILCMHPEATYVSNWLARFPRASRLAALNRLPLRRPDLQRSVWFGQDGANAYVYGRRRVLRERMFPMPVEGEPMFAACGIPDTGQPPDAPRSAEALRAAVRRIGDASGGSIFVNKRIANIRRIPFLADTFPGARFVALVRDGRAVALSLSTVDWWPTHEVPWYGGTPTRWAAEGRDPWELCARNWVEELEAMEEGLGQIAPSRILRLSYEELIADPIRQLDAIAAFGGFTPDAGWHERVEALSFPDRNDRWRSSLDVEALATIEQIQELTLKEYGYEL
jgi:Sulfotransferase family